MFARLCLCLSLASFISAADFSAVADGKADATAELQKAIDSGSGALVLPKGSFRLTQSLVIDLDKLGHTSVNGQGVARLIMAGAGPAIKVIGTHTDGSADPKSLKPNVWDHQLMPLIDALEITGEHAEADGIEAVGTHEMTITRTTIHHCRHAVHLVQRNRNMAINACHFYYNTGIGVFYDDVNLHQSNITGCHISYCYGGGVVSHAGNVRNVQISGCDIESNMSVDFPPAANVLLDSTGGSIGEVAITGCTLQHSNKAPGGANIRILGAGDDASLERRTGGKFTREGNVTIADNVFSDVQCNIDMSDARGVTITGNTFWEGFEYDLRIKNSSHIVVANNNFDRNPRYLVNGFNAAENNGILFSGCADCNVQGNVVSGVMRQRAAIDITDCTRFHIAHNSILDSDGDGLLLEKVSRSLISDNIIRDDRPEDQRSKFPSLHVIGGSDNLIGSNLLGNGRKVE
jgi:hypothetical protein